jgi:hypothetical protein
MLRLLPALLLTAFAPSVQASFISPVLRYADLYVAPKGVLLVSTGNGVFRNLDGRKDWTKVAVVNGEHGKFTLIGDQLFVATSAGTYQSSRTGSTWKRIGNEHQVDAADGQGALFGCSPDGDKVELSDNGAKRWRPTASKPGLPTDGCERVDASGAFLYASMSSGIYRSNDRGRHWELLKVPGSLRQFAPARSGALYAIVEAEGMYRSIDQGRHWQALFHGSTLVPDTFHFAAESTMYLTCSDANGLTLCSSRDGKALRPLRSGAKNLSQVVLQRGEGGKMFGMINDKVTMRDARGTWWDL